MKFALFVLAAVTTFSACSQSTPSSLVKSELYPLTISCNMNLTETSESYSCNEYEVNSEREQNFISGMCQLAGKDLAGELDEMGEIPVTVSKIPCNKKIATHSCDAVSEIDGKVDTTYYYISDKEDASMAIESCDKLNGSLR